jgi:adenine-specific DNA-methyltransferase
LSILAEVDLLRIKANSELNAKTKAALGQFFTSSPICLYMASLFSNMSGDIKLLDPGCGPGSLTAAFVDEAIKRNKTKSIVIKAFDIEPAIKPYISETLDLCAKEASKSGIKLTSNFNLADFIFTYSDSTTGLFAKDNDYTHVIMNPPYKKISTDSNYRRALRISDIETVNLYAGFVALAIKKLIPGGELVAIIPRSFCNGPYYQPFREIILQETAIQHIHIFDSRTNAFSDDEVLQENIVIHLIKGKEQGDVTITSSPEADFRYDDETSTITATDETIRVVPFNTIVAPGDDNKFIHIAANERDNEIVNALSYFNTFISDIGLDVSTGPVVDFRLKDDLRKDYEKDTVPLIYPIHLNGGVNWPKNSKKPNAIAISKKSKIWLWQNAGYFVIVRRFSSKEEKRRIVATVYDGSLPGNFIGFDNKLNVYHTNKKGFNREIALGLYVYLNSTILDKYYRLFGGHTQVNATDLRTILYPNTDSLTRMGSEVKNLNMSQELIDKLLEQEIRRMSGNANSPLANQTKINQVLRILANLGMPRAQLNERSALTLLALLNLHPTGKWNEIERPMLGVTPIMDWCRDIYGKAYKPNTRETFRRQTLHQFVAAGLCLYNPDEPGRSVNSPKACYQITTELYDLLVKYETDEWDIALQNWLAQRQTLTIQYAMPREMQKIPLTLRDGTQIKLSPGDHSQLIHDIITEFGPRFAPGSEVIYIGDTGAKEEFFKEVLLAELGVTVNRKGKLPDVVLYWAEKNWLLLIESVTSHGPVDGKRHAELSKLFATAKPDLIYVSAFPDRRTMNFYLSDISWETEVWIADSPDHMIHFNGDKFLGPH